MGKESASPGGLFLALPPRVPLVSDGMLTRGTPILYREGMSLSGLPSVAGSGVWKDSPPSCVRWIGCTCPAAVLYSGPEVPNQLTFFPPLRVLRGLSLLPFPRFIAVLREEQGERVYAILTGPESVFTFRF